jgi:hypothetical protein
LTKPARQHRACFRTGGNKQFASPGFAQAAELAEYGMMRRPQPAARRLVHVMATRPERESLFAIGIFSSRPMLLAVLATFMLQMATICLPALDPVQDRAAGRRRTAVLHRDILRGAVCGRAGEMAGAARLDLPCRLSPCARRRMPSH